MIRLAPRASRSAQVGRVPSKGRLRRYTPAGSKPSHGTTRGEGVIVNARCAGSKEDGSSCERIVGASQAYCYSHDPRRAAERRRNASKGGRRKANAEVAELKAQLKKLAAGVLSGEVERGRQPR